MIMDYVGYIRRHKEEYKKIQAKGREMRNDVTL